MTVAGKYGPDNFCDPNGKPVKNTPFTVRQNGVLSVLYADENRSATVENPGMSDSLGNISFWAEPGYHDLTVGETTLSVAVDTIGGDEGTAPTSLVFNSSGDQGGNRYNDWADLIDAIGQAQGRVDVWLEQDETVPVGAWDLAQSVWHGNRSDAWLNGITLTVPTGASFSRWIAPFIGDALAVVNEGTPMMEVTESTAIMCDRGAFFAAVDAECFTVTGDSATVSLTLIVESRVFNGPEPLFEAGFGPPSYGNYEVVNLVAPSVFAVVLDGPRTIIPDAPIVRGIDTAIAVLVVHDAAAARTEWTNPNFAGYTVPTLDYVNAEIHTVDMFTGDFDAAGGAFSEVPLFEVPLFGATTVPRAVVVGATVAVTIGDSTGLWTITASGPCTPGAALTLGDVIASGTGRIGVAASPDGTPTVAGIAVAAVTDQIDILDGRVDALDGRVDALEAGGSHVFYEAASEAAMLALPADQGDWCFRSDMQWSLYLLAGPDPSNLGDWTLIRHGDGTLPPISTGLAEARGDLFVATADNTVTRLPVGTTGQVLTVDSAQTAGVKWAATSGGGSGLTGATVVSPVGGVADVAAAVNAGATSVSIVTEASKIIMPAVSNSMGKQFTLILFGYATWPTVTFVDPEDDPINVVLANPDPVHKAFMWQMSPYTFSGVFGWFGGSIDTSYNNPVVSVGKVVHSDDFSGSATYYNTLMVDPGNPGGSGHPADFAIDAAYTPADFYDFLGGVPGTYTLVFAPDFGVKWAKLGIDPAISWMDLSPTPDLVSFYTGSPTAIEGFAANLLHGWRVILPTASEGVELGETSTTAYRGDRGKTAYDHSQATGNPHSTSAGDVGAPPTTRTISTGTGLTGGGDLSADRTLAIDAATLARIGTTVRATSDVTRTSTTVTADSVLQFTGQTGETYWIDGYLTFTGDATADIKVTVTIPGGTLSVTVQHPLTTVSGPQDYDRFWTLASSGDTAIGGIAGASTPIAVRIAGWVNLTSTGTVAIGWAPNVTGAGTGITRKANSLLYYRLAT